LSTARFYTAAGGNSGATTFTLAAGGTAIVNVVTINGEKRYYIKN
jgi:Na+/glutamate symporter